MDKYPHKLQMHIERKQSSSGNFIQTLGLNMKTKQNILTYFSFKITLGATGGTG
jgi:hypothetical protein